MEGGITLIEGKNTPHFVVILLFSILMDKLLSIRLFCPLELILDYPFRIMSLQEFPFQIFQMEVCIYILGWHNSAGILVIENEVAIVNY